MCAMHLLWGNGYGGCSCFQLQNDGKVTEKCVGNKIPPTESDEENITCANADSSKASEKEIFGVLSEQQCVKDARTDSITARDTLDELNAVFNRGTTALDRAQSYADNAKMLAAAAQKLAGIAVPKTPDPPIDSIGHLIQFVLAYGAGVSPSWSLIALKGPGLNGPLVSGSVNRTHILQLALGSPSGGGPSSS